MREKQLCLAPDNEVNISGIDQAKLWSLFKIIKSPADGHCFLHSVRYYLNTQLNRQYKLSNMQLIKSIRAETTKNLIYYSHFVNGVSTECLLKQVDDYCIHKIYDSCFGDILPVITANVLNVDIEIMEMYMGKPRLTRIPCIANGNNISNLVMVFKEGEHYDAIIPRSKLCKYNTPEQTSLLEVSSNDKSGLLQSSRGLGDSDINNAYDHNMDTRCTPRGTAVPKIMSRSGGNKLRDFVVSRNDISIVASNEIEGYYTRNSEVSISDCNNEAQRIRPEPVNNSTKSQPLHDVSNVTATNRNDVMRHLKILFWNINGLTQFKLHDDVTGNMLKENDIVLLNETWSNDDDSFELDGFTYWNFPRETKNKFAKRNSGGLGVFIRNSIKNGVSFIRNNQDLICWFKLSKVFFTLENDVYLANIYVVPHGSVYERYDAFDEIQNDISGLPADCHVLLCGDFNARTNTAADYCLDVIEGSVGALSEVLPPDYHHANDGTHVLRKNNILQRYSHDKASVNKNGQNLLNMCISSNLFIANGRLGLDKNIGEFTRIDTTGKSVVDYLIT